MAHLGDDYVLTLLHSERSKLYTIIIISLDFFYAQAYS